MRKLQLIIKRIMDIVLSFIGLIVLSPTFIIISIMIYIKLGRPIFFIQERPGKYGEIFKMIKFRTMLNIKDKYGELLPNEKRLTKFGRALRSTSLDELPELINVLKGDMSLVGPRPLLIEYLPLYNKHQARRHEVRPGITGLAQVNGRNAISWEEKFNYDVWYVDNFSIFLDIQILVKTIIKVFRRENINQSENVTMTKFQGTQES
ncbi:sugar transferase [Garciella nitratireducens]|uniref:sugar transferase n=1 Tax=Garciella nitratireducens TaxID=218205 RepID=UPI000DE89F51|nr:sugar transferase [Garciella nitratireducens]RBP42232.1 lipopolysaccharide/colanic/teichoic acid biosynthesis glycosyltransferase [Garciella nitratireducens]